MKERDVIGRLRAAFGAWGIGDDAAVLPPLDGDLLFASDAVVEGVHFRRDYATIRQVLEKVITSNVSDIYAMGGAPQSILLTAGLPEGFGEPDLNGIVEGVEEACRAYHIRLIGGDTVRSPGGCFFDVAITGSVGRGRAVPRSGARSGDAIICFGECGGSLAGMLLLEQAHGGGVREGRGGDRGAGRYGNRGGGRGDDEELHRRGDSDCGSGGRRRLGSIGAKFLAEIARVDGDALAAIRRLVPELSLAMTTDDMERLCAANGLGKDAVPLVQLAKQHLVPLAIPLDPAVLASTEAPVSAMIDVSDGLSKDLATLCAESGVGAVVHEALIPVPDSFSRAAVSIAPDVLTDIVLSSGEEYVLLATVRGIDVGSEPPAGKVIGRIVDRREGLTLVGRDGKRRPWPELGYEHEF